MKSYNFKFDHPGTNIYSILMIIPAFIFLIMGFISPREKSIPDFLLSFLFFAGYFWFKKNKNELKDDVKTIIKINHQKIF